MFDIIISIIFVYLIFSGVTIPFFIDDIVFVIFGISTPKGDLNRRAKFLYGFLLGLILVLFIVGIYLAINGKIGITGLTTLV